MPDDNGFAIRGKDKAVFVNDLFKEAAMHRPTADWKTSWNYYTGDQTWTTALQKQNCARANYIVYIIGRIMAEFSQSDLVPHVEGVQDKIDEPLARALGAAVEKCLLRQRFSQKLMLADFYALVFGCTFWKVEWSQTMRDMVAIPLPPYSVFVDPAARELHGAHGARYIVHAELRDVDMLRREFKRKDIVADSEAGFGESVHNFPWRADDRVAAGRKGKQAIVKQCWLRDADTAKYPQGRVITVVGNIAVRDLPNQYPYRYGLPFAQHYGGTPGGELYGLSLVRDLKPIQDIINRRLEQVVSNENVMANPKYVTDSPQGVEPSYDARIGDVLTVHRGSKLDILQWSGMPTGVYRSLDLGKRMLEEISGINEISQGRQPGDVRSGVALNVLNENMLASIRLRERYRLQAVRAVFRMIVKGVQHFYDPMDIYKLVDPELAETIDWNAADEEISRETDVTVRVQPSQARQRMEDVQLALQLFGAGVIDQRAVLERAPDYTDKDQIIERMEQAKLAEQEAAMQAQLAEAGAGGEVPQGADMGASAAPMGAEEEVPVAESNIGY